MANDRSMANFTVKVNGQELGQERRSNVLSIVVDESIQLPDHFAVRLADPDFEIFDSGDFEMGSKIEVAFQGTGELTVVTVGEVTSLSMEQGPLKTHELVVEGFDPTHRLHRGPKTRTFVQMTDSDIANKVAKEYSLKSQIDRTSIVHDYVVQYSQSDYAFLIARARSIGYDLWVADETLFFKKQPEARVDPPQLIWRGNLVEFRARFSAAERCDEVLVNAWDHVKKEPIQGRSDERDAGSDAPAVEETATEAKRAFGSVKRTMSTRPLGTRSEANSLATSLALLASGGEAVARGVCQGDPTISAGSLVQIGSVGSRLSGQYRITETRHTIEPGQPYLTRFVVGAKESAALPDLLRPASPNGSLGPIFGKVTDVSDPRNYGRVKVEFGHLPGVESTWAAAVSPGAGAERGIQFLPEIGDQVLVAFEMGDPARPVVLGGVWSGGDALAEPDSVAGGKIDKRTMKSRIGHHLTFDDKGAGRILLALGDDSSSLHLEATESKLVGDQKLTVQSTDIEIVATGKLILRGNQIEIAANADVKVSGALIKLN